MKNKQIFYLSERCKIFLSALLLFMSLVVFAQESNEKLYTLYAKNGMSAQSAACYGDYLVLVKKFVSKIGLYNLNTKKLLCTNQLQPWTELQGGADIFHANNSSFGLQKFKESDPFPLLYVSHRVNNDKRGVLQVFRVLPLKSNGDKTDFDSLSVSLVQTIYYPMMTDENALGSPWTVIDKENNCMYTYSRNNRGKAKNKGICRISKFVIPPVDKNREIYLSDDDILDSYEVGFKAPLSQGACIHKGKMYIAQGEPNNYIWLRVIDLKKKELIESINLKKAGFPAEPEGCYIFDNHLMLSTGGKRIFKINIPID